MENGNECQEVSNAKYDCLLFDLDDTLYPLSSGLAVHVRENIQEYMLEKLGIEETKVPELNVSLYKTYGTTMAGLRAVGYDFNYGDFHSFVHGRLPYDTLKPDPVFRGLLLSLPLRKIVFTNSDEGHAVRVLQRLGLDDCFERIISFETLNPSNDDHPHGDEDGNKSATFDFYEYMRQPHSDMVLPKTPVVCKPFEAAFERVFEMANINPQRTYWPLPLIMMLPARNDIINLFFFPCCFQLFFDDSVRNLQTAERLGLHTVLVGTSLRTTGVDHALESIHNIREAFPELWEDDEKHERVRCSSKVAMEQSVLA